MRDGGSPLTGDCCRFFLERVLRDRRNGRVGDVPIPYAKLDDLICAELTTVRPLNLVGLRGDYLVKKGVSTDAIRASSHRLGQHSLPITKTLTASAQSNANGSVGIDI